jgi:hypothetical protein
MDIGLAGSYSPFFRVNSPFFRANLLFSGRYPQTSHEKKWVIKFHALLYLRESNPEKGRICEKVAT